MKILDGFPAVPQSVYVLAFSSIFVISAIYAYFLSEDARTS